MMRQVWESTSSGTDCGITRRTSSRDLPKSLGEAIIGALREEAPAKATLTNFHRHLRHTIIESERRKFVLLTGPAKNQCAIRSFSIVSLLAVSTLAGAASHWACAAEIVAADKVQFNRDIGRSWRRIVSTVTTIHKPKPVCGLTFATRRLQPLNRAKSQSCRAMPEKSALVARIFSGPTRMTVRLLRKPNRVLTGRQKKVDLKRWIAEGAKDEAAVGVTPRSGRLDSLPPVSDQNGRVTRSIVLCSPSWSRMG